MVGEFRLRSICHEQALVLDALGIPHLIADGPRHAAVLLVPVEHAARAREQLALYRAENRRLPMGAPEFVPLGRGLSGVAGYVALLVLVFWWQTRAAFGIDWLAAGGLSGTAVRAGEWWRLATALTLHGDGAHLLANLVFGGFFGAFVGQYLGVGVAWLVILAAAMLGNGLDLALLPPSHRAIGASTAVFAALGLLAALMWRLSSRRNLSWAQRFAPLIGAGVLLAYLGTGDAQTDAVAHLTGFCAGLVAGVALSALRPWWINARVVQIAAALAALGILATSWWLAVDAWRTDLA